MGFWDIGPFDNTSARELVDSIRAGRFSFARFKFECCGGPLDADGEASIIALDALLNHPAQRPSGVTADMLAAFNQPENRAWVRRQRERLVADRNSAIFAQFDAAGQAESWLHRMNTVTWRSG